jgi:hypothetical protein
VESEDELKEIQDSLFPTKCTDVRSYSARLFENMGNLKTVLDVSFVH